MGLIRIFTGTTTEDEDDVIEVEVEDDEDDSGGRSVLRTLFALAVVAGLVYAVSRVARSDADEFTDIELDPVPDTDSESEATA